MNNIDILNNILSSLKEGRLDLINDDNTMFINSLSIALLNKEPLSNEDMQCIKYILTISNILYENTSNDILPLEDGIYDLLIAKYNKNNGEPVVGAVNIKFKDGPNIKYKSPLQKIALFRNDDKVNQFMFKEELIDPFPIQRRYVLNNLVDFRYNSNISKRNVNISHEYPELVGTLDKCKFVLCSKAEEVGASNSSNVNILERDFFGEHISKGIITPNEKFKVIVELKYDGISVEATVNNSIISARSRGDAINDLAADLTPILYGYKFPNAVPVEDEFGIKFEAVMTYNNLYKFNMAKEYNYKNCRTAIIGLMGSSDASLYRDYITLVPLSTSLNIDRLTEIEFLNKYYTSGEFLRCAVIYGNYIEVLFQIQKFLEEAEYLRPYMPIMYDGIVVSYLDENIKNKLGRSNAINKYSMAVKFNALKRLTTFRGYSYSVGQNGMVVPMAHFDPVEFYGTIHDKTTAHSYERFKNLNLRLGDIIEATYSNDCIVYITKPDNSFNEQNSINPPIEFIENCPSCGTKLVPSQSGKTMLCTNINCPEKNLKRIVNMISKLNFKDFAEASLLSLNKYTLTDLLNLTYDDVKILGEADSKLFMVRMNELKTKPIYDYKIIGALGFTGIASEKWKKIFKVYTLNQLLSFNIDELKSKLKEIKGLGTVTAETICTEWEFFINDIITISKMKNVISSINEKESLSIRFTGFRDKGLLEYLVALGYDATDGSVTKSTDILLVPYDGFTSTKTSKVGPNTIIVDVDDFKDNMDKYLK